VIARLWGLHSQLVSEPQQVRREGGRDLFQQGIAEGGGDRPSSAARRHLYREFFNCFIGRRDSVIVQD
jgi:hypothetical protein